MFGLYIDISKLQLNCTNSNLLFNNKTIGWLLSAGYLTYSFVSFKLAFCITDMMLIWHNVQGLIYTHIWYILLLIMIILMKIMIIILIMIMTMTTTTMTTNNNNNSFCFNVNNHTDVKVPASLLCVFYKRNYNALLTFSPKSITAKLSQISDWPCHRSARWCPGNAGGN